MLPLRTFNIHVNLSNPKNIIFSRKGFFRLTLRKDGSFENRPPECSLGSQKLLWKTPFRTSQIIILRKIPQYLTYVLQKRSQQCQKLCSYVSAIKSRRSQYKLRNFSSNSPKIKWGVYLQKQITPFLNIFKNHVFYYVIMFLLCFVLVSWFF